MEGMEGQRAPERPVMRQVWRHLGFLHWPVDGDALAPLLPPGLSVEPFEGAAYVGVVPFTISLSRAAGLGLPLAPAFHELNLRTYVRNADGIAGVWFFSLEATSRLAVFGARAIYHLPYFHAEIAMVAAPAADPATPTIAYDARRLRDPGTQFRARYRPTGPVRTATPGSLESFLVERYLLYAWNGRSLSTTRVAHAPYPLQPAAVDECAQTLTSAAGLPPLAGPPTYAHYAREVDVRIFRPHRATSS